MQDIDTEGAHLADYFSTYFTITKVYTIKKKKYIIY